MRHAIFLLCLLVMLSPCLAFGEPVILDEIIVQGTALPATEETLTIREVRESSARDIGEALENLPGVTSVRKGGIANDIVLRGFQGDDISVLMDGVRVHGGCPSRMDPPAFHFDFAEVQAINVTKGPYALRYPGNLGGTVDIESADISPGTGFAANLTYGSFDLVHGSITGSYGGDAFEGLLGYAYKYSLPPEAGNGKRITDIYPATSPNRYRPEHIDSRAYDINTVWLKSGHQLSSSTRSDLSLSYQDAGHVLYPGLLMDAEYDRTTRLDWTTRTENVGKLQELEFQLYMTKVEHLMNDRWRESSRPSMMVTRDVMMETDAETGVLGASLFASGDLAGGGLSAGIDAYHRNWDAENISAMWMAYAPQPMIPDVGSDNLGLFTAYARTLNDQWNLKGELRLDHHASDATALSDSRLASLYQPYYPATTLDNDNDFSEPSANLQVFWTPQDGLEVFAGMASAARMPDPQELYIGLQRMMGANWVGNPGLDPVRNNQADLGVKFSGGNYLLSTTVFYSRVDDYITLTSLADPDGAGPLIQARSYTNIDAEIWGGELGLQVSLPMDLFLIGDLSYTEGENRETGTPLAEMPPLMGSAALRYDIETLFVELGERFADRQDRVDTALLEEETAGWAVTDLKAGLSLDKWRVIAGINNLFDTYYETHLSYQRDPFRSGLKVPETGRFAYITLGYSF